MSNEKPQTFDERLKQCVVIALAFRLMNEPTGMWSAEEVCRDARGFFRNDENFSQEAALVTPENTTETLRSLVGTGKEGYLHGWNEYRGNSPLPAEIREQLDYANAH